LVYPSFAAKKDLMLSHGAKVRPLIIVSYAFFALSLIIAHCVLGLSSSERVFVALVVGAVVTMLCYGLSVVVSGWLEIGAKRPGDR
jgi:hypothetical protein